MEEARKFPATWHWETGRRSNSQNLAASIQRDRLPLVVQEAVLRELAEDYDRHSLEDKRCRAAYACVSLQWQEFFEKLNFNKIVLHPSALRDFGKLLKRRSQNRKSGDMGRQSQKTAAKACPSLSRMPRIQHIWLRIELLAYDCRRCKLPEEPKEAVRNNVIFTQAVWTLLNILSDWERRDSNQDLTLELSAYSPSDAHHCFRDNAGLQHDYPNLDPMSLQKDYIVRYDNGVLSGDDKLNDVFHGFSSGQYNSISTGMSLHPETVAERLIRLLNFDFFGIRPNGGQSGHKLPAVKMISSFLLRRQFYRELCPYAFSKLLRETITGLRNIRYERWRLPHPLFQKMYEMSFGPIEMDFGPMDQHVPGTGIVLGHGLPSTLETLSLFEDSSSKSPEAEDVGEAYGSDEFRSSRIRVLEGLAGRALNLKHLSVSFLSDAMDCFKLPADALPNLQSLALTSQEHLLPTDCKVRRILLDAATAVTILPKLQIMELWNCGKGHAAIFRYEAAEIVPSRTCKLTWRSSWHMTRSRIGVDVTKTWEHATHKASHELTFALDPSPPDPYTKYGAILRHLKLRDFILDPVSAMQARAGIDEEGQPEVPAWKASIPYSPMRSASHKDWNLNTANYKKNKN